MESERVEKSTVQRILAKMRAAVEKDPDSPLRMYVEHDPGEDYDPNQTPEERQLDADD